MSDYTSGLDAELTRLDAEITDAQGEIAGLDAALDALTARVVALEGTPPPDPPPVPTGTLTLDRTSGNAPLNVVATIAVQDADNFQITWDDGLVGIVHIPTDVTISHTYAQAGTFHPQMRVWSASVPEGVLVAGPTVTTTAPPPPPPPPGGTVGKLYGGISLPLAQSPDTDIDRIAAAGFGWYRFDVRIATVSPSRGTFNWSTYDPVFTHAASKGLNVNAICYMLPQWMNGSTNDKQKPTVLQDYADWCGQAAPHLYSMGVRSMELWNEQNWGFWLPTPDRQTYVTMAIAAAKAIHAAVPQMTVVSGGLSTADTEYQASPTHATLAGYTSPWPGCHQTLDHYGHLGLFDYVDAVAIHPYLDGIDPSPTGGDPNWCNWAGVSMRTTIGIIDKWTTRKLPVWNTESACPRSTTSEATQATRAAHAYQAYTTWTLADGSPMRPRLGPYFWFTFRDWTPGQPAREASFGLVAPDYYPHQALAAVSTELAKSVT